MLHYFTPSCIRSTALIVGIFCPTLLLASPERDLVIAFMGQCSNNAGRIDKVEAAARVFSYQELTGDQAMMLAPQDPNAYFRGWFVKEGEGSPYLLGVAEGKFKGRDYAICTISKPRHDIDVVVSEMVTVVGLGPLIETDMTGGQRTRVWDASAIAAGAFVLVTDAKHLGLEGGSISFFSPKVR